MLSDEKKYVDDMKSAILADCFPPACILLVMIACPETKDEATLSNIYYFAADDSLDNTINSSYYQLLPTEA